MEPKVTGLSPMTGPPGTKITVRGENLGQSGNDIVRLTINGADCLPYLEWKSPKKIITRCSRVLGNGDIVITTNSGGIGTCDVQFNCYEETVGPLDESAVWVDEDFHIPEKEKLNILGSAEEYSVEISSSRFKPQLYLIQNHADADFSELERLQKTMEAKLAIKNNPEVVDSSSNRASIMKSNLPVIMECLHILERLSKVITTSRDTSIDNIVRSIRDSLTKTHDLFDPLLAQKDLVQSIESAMQVLRQNETLFNLPSAIETSIKTKNYDSVVKEIAAVMSRPKSGDMEQTLIENIQLEVSAKVEELKATIREQLHQCCQSTNGARNIEEIKKLISYLNKLGEPVNVWIALKTMSKSLIDTLNEKSRYYLGLCLDENDEKLPIVKFVQCAMEIFNNTFYNILALGQSYFDLKDEFACKENEETRQSRQIEFDETMVKESIAHLSGTLRSALVPDSSKLEKPSLWPLFESSSYTEWLRHVLQAVITCHIHLTKVNLPLSAREPLEDFKELVFELRKRSMRILFESAARANKNLDRQEDWVIDVDDLFGGRTNLPSIFEKNVVETLKFGAETIFKPSSPHENSILKRVDVQALMKELAQSLINSFIESLDRALIDSHEHPAESDRDLLASRNSKRLPSKYTNRLLITICNCQFTRDRILPRLQDEFEKLQGLKMDRVFANCREKYGDYILKISEKFCEIKCSELVVNYDLQINLMIINSQIFLVAPQLVNNLMTSIVNKLR